jgi:hypothetical protein
MHQELSLPARRKQITGWMGIAAIAIGYLALYAINFWIPLGHTNYTTRIWDWSLTALTLVALFVVAAKRRNLDAGTSLLGLVLAAISAFSYSLDYPDFRGSLEEGLAVWVCLLGGVALFRDLKTQVVPAFQPPLTNIGRSLLFGMAVAIPLAAVNNLYFYLNAGEVQFTNVFYSAIEALSPAIHEEIVFRFFVLAVCLSLLKGITSPSLRIFAAIFLAVVPHSLNHLPDLFLQNPLMGLLMLTATSLLFGLPMAWLQVRRNLETAIAFHWFIDFIRFLFGF